MLLPRAKVQKARATSAAVQRGPMASRQRGASELSTCHRFATEIFQEGVVVHEVSGKNNHLIVNHLILVGDMEHGTISLVGGFARNRSEPAERRLGLAMRKGGTWGVLLAVPQVSRSIAELQELEISSSENRELLQETTQSCQTVCCLVSLL